MEETASYSIGNEPAPLPVMIEGVRAEVRSLCDHMTGDNYVEQLREILRVVALARFMVGKKGYGNDVQR